MKLLAPDGRKTVTVAPIADFASGVCRRRFRARRSSGALASQIPLLASVPPTRKSGYGRSRRVTRNVVRTTKWFQNRFRLGKGHDVRRHRGDHHRDFLEPALEQSERRASAVARNFTRSLHEGLNIFSKTIRVRRQAAMGRVSVAPPDDSQNEGHLSSGSQRALRLGFRKVVSIGGCPDVLRGRRRWPECQWSIKFGWASSLSARPCRKPTAARTLP